MSRPGAVPRSGPALPAQRAPGAARARLGSSERSGEDHARRSRADAR
ncbi:hypothetical protein QFZ22_009798, partial [Streptomyces canus]|nr:hypothetical protein [Streptomyces canus]